MMKRRPGANANEPFSDSDADSDKYAKSSKGSRKFLKFLSPMQWLSVVVILVALVGLWKYLETTSRHLESIRTAEKTANIQRIASLEKELAQTRDLMEKLNALEDEDDKNDSKKRPSKAKSGSVKIWRTLPSSDVWCQGDRRFNRICRFRNLCYDPKDEVWFILKTRRSVIQNVPFNSTEYSFLELSTVENHSVFYWDFVEASPYSEKFRNRLVRYETSPHFLFSRLHPRNIMHNIHDDILGLFYHIRQYVGRGEERWQMPFSLDTHHLLLLDPYGQTDSTRPLQYLSDYPVRFKKEFLDKNKEVTTCFRDATVGNSKIATFYQYGFVEPQSKLMGKDLNGMYVKEVAEWFVRRMREKVGFDEDVHEHPPKYPKNQYFGNKVSDLDLKETDLIVILRRKSNRLILNEDELANALTEQFKLETVFVSNEDHTFENQVKYLRRARAVLAMHGSILMMIMFCRRGTVVIEMFPFAVPSQNYTPYKTLAELTGMELVYRAWENKDESATVGHPDNHELMGGLAQLTEKERQEVLDTKTVPTHICCTSRFWLYRIYQDTKVNLKEVGDLITDALQESRDKVLNNLYEFNWDEAVFVKPPPVFKVECLNGTKRKSGELWASWDEAWNEAKVDKWNVYIVNSKSEYATNTEKPAIAIPGFKPGELVKFQIRPLVQGYKGFWGSVLSCTV